MSGERRVDQDPVNAAPVLSGRVAAGVSHGPPDRVMAGRDQTVSRGHGVRRRAR